MSALGRCARFCLSRATYLHRGLHFPNALKDVRIIANEPQPAVFSFMQRKQLHQAVQEEKVFPYRSPRSLTKLDNKLHSLGYVLKTNITDCLKEFDKEGMRDLEDGLKVLRCTGASLSEVHPEKRMELTEEAWKHLENFSKKKGVPLKTLAYNQLLLVYLENKHKFEPHEFLEKMEQNNVEPNRVTYMLILAAYCENGDIEKASQILEFMKERDMPLSENVFNRLIIGHFRANDVEGAENMVNIMKSSGVEPKSKTYYSLLQGYAEKGDIEAIKKVMATAEESKSRLNTFQMYNAILSAVISGHEDTAFQIFDLISDSKMDHDDTVAPVLQQMICYGHVDIAMKLENILLKRISRKKLLIQCMICNFSPDERYDKILIDFIEKCKTEPLYVYDIVKHAFTEKRTDWAMRILVLAKDNEIEIRNHMFFPACAQYAESGNKQGLHDVLKLLLPDGTAQIHIAVYLFWQIFPILTTNGMAVEDIYSDLKELNFPTTAIDFAVFATLARDNPPKAVEFAKGKKIIKFSKIDTVQRANVKTWWKEFFQILSVIHNKHENLNEQEDVLEEALRQKCDAADEIVKYFNSQNLAVSAAGKERMQKDGLFDSVLPEEFVASTQGNDWRQREFVKTNDLKEMSFDEVKAVAEKKPHFTSALNEYVKRLCQEENITEINKIFSTGMTVGPLALSDVIKMYIKLEDLPMCLKYLDKMDSEFDDYTDVKSLLSVSLLLLRGGKFNEILPLFQRIFDKADGGKHYLFIKEWFLLGKEMASLVEPNDSIMFYDQTAEMPFFKQNHFEKMNLSHFLEGLVDGYVNRGDKQMLVDVVQEMTKRKLHFKDFRKILTYFIEKEDSAGLQQVMDLLYETEPQRNIILNLIFCLVVNNKPEQARDVAQTPGLTGNMKILNMLGDQLINSKEVEKLKTLVDITKDLPLCSRDQMLFLLIKGYVATDNFTAARDVLTIYEEEGIVPSLETLKFLAAKMKAKDMEVDFYVPNTQMESRKKEKSQELPSDPKFLTVQEKMNDKFYDNLSTIFESEDFKDVEDRKKLCEWMSKVSPRFQIIFRRFLAIQGEVDLLTHIKDDLGYGNDFDIAYAKAVRNPSSLIADLDLSSPENLNKYVSHQMLKNLWDKSPDVFEEVADLIRKNAATIPTAVTSLCKIYLSNSPERFEELVKEIPLEKKKTLDLNGTSKMLSRYKKEDGLLKLLEFSRQIGKSISIYPEVIQLYARTRDIAKCQQVLADLKSDGYSLENLNSSTQEKIRDLFAECNLQSELDELFKK